MEFSLASVILTANIAIIRDIKERFGIEKSFFPILIITSVFFLYLCNRNEKKGSYGRSIHE